MNEKEKAFREYCRQYKLTSHTKNDFLGSWETDSDEIQYDLRYSKTDEPDSQGRWARVAYYKGIEIAWINRTKLLNGWDRFDIIFFHGLHLESRFSLEEAKDFVEVKLENFLDSLI